MKNKIRTVTDIFNEAALDMFYEGRIALYVDTEEMAKTLENFCRLNKIELNLFDDLWKITPYNTYVISYIRADINTGQGIGDRILLCYCGKGEECELDVLTASKILEPDVI